MKNNNKGFSLVELIIVIGMLAIVGGMVVSFVTFSTRTYTRASAEIDIQEEAQLTLNQVKDLMIDTNRAVSYGLEAPDPSNMKAFTVIDESNTEASIRADWIADGVNQDYIKEVLVVYSEESHAVTQADGTVVTTYTYPIVKIIYNQFTGELYYAEQTFSDTSLIDISSFGTTSADTYLLSQYVTDFNVDLTNIEESQVDMRVDFSSDSIAGSGREYMATPTINLRNKVIVSENLTDIYTNPGVEINSFIAGIDVLKSNIVIHNDVIQTGTSATYTAQVDAQYGASEGYTWSLSGDHAGFKSTLDAATGTVTVPIDEPSSMLTLTAIATGDTSKTKTIPITVSQGVSVNNFFITVEENPISNAGPEEVRMVYTFTATTRFSDGHETQGQNITWTQPSNIPAGSTCFVNGAGQLVLSLKQDAGGREYEVSAVTTEVNAAGNYLDDDVIVSPPDLTYIQPINMLVEINPNNVDILSRGDSIDLSADVDFNGDTSSLTYHWEILSDESSGFSGSGIDGINKISLPDIDSENNTISAAKDLNWSSAYMVRVKLTVTGTANGSAVEGTQTKDIQILPVTMNVNILETTRYDRRLAQKFSYSFENVLLTQSEINSTSRYFTYTGEGYLTYYSGYDVTIPHDYIRTNRQKIWTSDTIARAGVRRKNDVYFPYWGGYYNTTMRVLNYKFTVAYDGNNSVSYQGTITY